MTTDPTFTAKPRDVERAFATVFPHVGNDAHLPMLTAVHLELSGFELLLSASDRYTVAFYRADLTEWAEKDATVQAAEPLTVNLFARDLRRLFAFSRDHKGQPAEWRLSDAALAVVLVDGSQLSVRTVEVGFPDVRAVIPTSQPDEVARLLNVGPDKFERFIKSADAVAAIDRTAAPMQVWPGGSPLKPITVTVGSRFVGLLMPVRVPDEDLTLDIAQTIAPPRAAIGAAKGSGQ